MTSSKPTISADDGSTVVESGVDKRDQPSRVLTGGVDRHAIVAQAVDGYLQAKADGRDLSISEFCSTYRQYGPAVQSSVYRQLEVERYFNANPECRQLAQSPDYPMAGDRVGKFHVLEELGRGALARVYLCDQVEPVHRQMVLKVGPPDLLEARIISRLQHAHIVPVYSIERDLERGATVLCMPFLGRSTLHDLTSTVLAEGAPKGAGLIDEVAHAWAKSIDLSQPQVELVDERRRYSTYISEIASIGAQLAGALAHAHSRGILHGDLKPSNVLLTTGAMACLMDFNLSGDLSSRVVPRGGTLPYMPPEQLRLLASDDVDSTNDYCDRSDLYSLGIILYELLAAAAPFSADDLPEDRKLAAEGLLERQRQRPQPIRSLNPSVNPPLARLVESMLAFDVEQRPDSAREVQRALKRQTSTLPRLQRRVLHRRRTTRAAAAVGLIAMLVGLVWFLFLPPKYERLCVQALKARNAGDLEAAKTLLDQAVAIKPDFWRGRFEMAKTLLGKGKYREAASEIYAIDRVFGRPELKLWEAYCYHVGSEFSMANRLYNQALRDLGPIQECGELHNNLAISCIDGRVGDTRQQQYATCRIHLEQANYLLPESPIVKWNFVLLEQTHAIEDLSYSPDEGQRFSRLLMDEYGDDPKLIATRAILLGLAARHDTALVDECVQNLRSLLKLDARWLFDLLKTPVVWEAVEEELGFQGLLDMRRRYEASGNLPDAAKSKLRRLIEPQVELKFDEWQQKPQ